MKKEKIIALVTVLLLMANSASAGVIDSVEESGDGVSEKEKRITVTGKIPLADDGDTVGREVIFAVYKSGVGIDDDGNVDLSKIDEYDASQLEYIAQKSADEDGYYSFDYVKSAETGKYLVRIGYNKSGGNPGEKIHEYISPADYLKFKSAIDEIYDKAGTDGYDAVSALKDCIDEYIGKDVLELSKYDELKANEDDESISFILGYVLLAGKPETTKELKKLFGEGYAINCFDNVTAEEISKIFEDGYCLDALSADEDVIKRFSENTESARKKVYEKLALKAVKEKTAAELLRDIYNAIILSEFDSVMWQGNLSVIEDYNSVLGVDLDEYNALETDKKKNKALTEFAAKVGTIIDISDVESKFKAAVKTAKDYSEPSESQTDTRTDKSDKGGSFGGVSLLPAVSGNTSITEITQSNASDSEEKTEAFTDIGDYAWASDAIENLTKKSIVSGDGKGNFRPGDYVTREEFVKMAILALKLSGRADEITFNDVSKDAWYYDYICGAVYYQLINGISADEFGVGKSIKRADVAVILERLLKMYGKEYSMKDIVYSDVLKENIGYAYDAIYTAAEAKLMNGTSETTFEPMRSITRAETAVVIDRLMKLLENN